MTGPREDGDAPSTTGGSPGSTRASVHRPPDGASPLSVPDVPEVGADLTGLSEAVQTGPRPFLVDGGALWVAGTERRAGFRVGTGYRVLAEVTIEGLGAVANVVLFPGVARRQSVGQRGSAVETLVSAPRLPLAAAQWSGGRGSGDDALPDEIVVEIHRPVGDGTGDPATVHRGDDHVTVDAGGTVTAVALHPPPVGLRVRERSDGGARVVFTPSQDGPLSLLVSSGSPERVRAALAAARHLPAHAVRAAAGPDDGLVLRSGVPEIDDAFLWLRSRLAARARRLASLQLASGLAAVAVGDRESAHRILASGDDTGPGHALLVARLASVLGDTGPAARVAERWVRDPPAGGPLTDLAAESLAEALDRIHSPEIVTRLRTLAKREVGGDGGDAISRPSPEGRPEGEESPPGSTTERRLPTVGAAAPSARGHPPEARGHAPEEATWWRALLSGDPSMPVPERGRPVLAEARRACARFVADPDEAWASWRRLLSGSPGDDDAPVTLWDLAPDAGEDASGSLTAELILAVVHGLLGLRSDAPVGRLRLAPRLPSHVTAFEVGGIPVGDATLAMRYRREEGLQTFELVPERAAVPPLVVFEPSVPGDVEEVRVDGEAAALELRVSGGRTTVPIQLPVDRPRMVEIRS